MIHHILKDFSFYSHKIKRVFNNAILLIKKLTLYLACGGFIALLCDYLESLKTKEILIGLLALCLFYLFYNRLEKIKEEQSFNNSNKFNDAVSREILSIKFKLDELLDDRAPCFKKSDNPGDETSRKLFSRYWRAYRGYQDIVSFQSYDTPDGREGALIILLQKYYAGTGHEGKDVYYYFDPIGEIEEFTEEKLIQLHSYGPKEYRHIEKLKEGDTLKAYIYDPEDFGFLEPYESVIKVICIEENKYNSDRNITLEIIEKHWHDGIFNIEREAVIRTIKHVYL